MHRDISVDVKDYTPLRCAERLVRETGLSARAIAMITHTTIATVEQLIRCNRIPC